MNLIELSIICALVCNRVIGQVNIADISLPLEETSDPNQSLLVGGGVSMFVVKIQHIHFEQSN